MPRLTLPLLLAAAFTATAPLPAQTSSASLRPQLEAVYNTWQRAMTAKDYVGWKEATATARQAITRNAVVSRKQPFPGAVFKLAISPPLLYPLRFLKAQEKGDTAVAIYFGKVDLGLDVAVIPDNLLVLHFIRERAGWRFDHTQVVNLDLNPEVRLGIAQGRRDFLNKAEFQPSGVVPPVLPAFPEPDHPAIIEVIAVGYEVKMHMNGLFVGKVADNHARDLLNGGLANGENRFRVEITPLEATPEDRRSLQIAFFVLRDAQRLPPKKVFHYAPETVPPSHEAPVWVNAVTLQGK